MYNDELIKKLAETAKRIMAGESVEAIEEGAEKDTKGDKEAYQKFFNDTLKKYGVKSPSELKGDDEKKFYDEIDAGWKGDDEKPEKNESVELEEAAKISGKDAYKWLTSNKVFDDEDFTNPPSFEDAVKSYRGSGPGLDAFINLAKKHGGKSPSGWWGWLGAAKNFYDKVLVPAAKGYASVEESVEELEEQTPDFHVKYAKSKHGPIQVTKFMTLDKAKKFLSDREAEGYRGIISKDGKPVKESEEALEESSSTNESIQALRPDFTGYRGRQEKNKYKEGDLERISAIEDKVKKSFKTVNTRWHAGVFGIRTKTMHMNFNPNGNLVVFNQKAQWNTKKGLLHIKLKWHNLSDKDIISKLRDFDAKIEVEYARTSELNKSEETELKEGKIDLKKKVKNEKEFESYMDSFKGPDILTAVEKLDSGEKHQKGTVGFFLSQQMSMKEETVRLDARRREFREKIKKLAYAKAKKMIQDQEGDEEEVDEGILSKVAGIGAVAAGAAIKKRLTRKGRNDLKQKKVDKLKSKAQEIDRSKRLKKDLVKAKSDLKKKKQQKESVMFESVVLTESQMSMIAKIKNDFKDFKKGKKYALAVSSVMALKQLMLAIGNNEDLLKGLLKADIPYLSAISKHTLIAKHGYSGRDFDSNIQDIEDYEDYDDDEETVEIVPLKPTLIQKIKNLFRRK